MFDVCPHCNAKRGEDCVTSSGRPTKPHKARQLYTHTPVTAPVVVSAMYGVQERIENRLSYSAIMSRIKADIEESFPEIIEDGTNMLKQWILDENHWIGKQARLQALNSIDLRDIVIKFISTLATQNTVDMKLVTLASMTCGFLPYADKAEALQTAAEIIGVLEPLGLWGHYRNSESTVFIEVYITLDEVMMEQLKYRFYLPPMLTKPNKLRANKDSGYLTQKDSLILGGGYNHHNGNISLDVLNTLNSITYEVDIEFLENFEEEWHQEELSYEEFKALSKSEKDLYRMDEDTWKVYREQCDAIYGHLVKHGNKFHFTHKVDKRGRVYSQGYHLNPQGKAYKKAMLNLAHKEICTGLEDWNNA